MDAMIQSPRRSAATVGALMVGLMSVYSTAAYIQSYKQMVNRWTTQLLNSDIVVTSSTLLRSSFVSLQRGSRKEIRRHCRA